MNPTLKGQCMRKNCAYHSKSVGSCDYLLITGRRRGCSIEDCDKYRKKKKGDPGLQPAPDASARETARIIDGIMKGR